MSTQVSQLGNQFLYGWKNSLYEQYTFNSMTEAQCVLATSLPCNPERLKEIALNLELDKRIENVVDIHGAQTQEDTGCYLVDRVVYVKCQHTATQRLEKQKFWKSVGVADITIELILGGASIGCLAAIRLLTLPPLIFVALICVVVFLVVSCLIKATSYKISPPIQAASLNQHPAHLVAKLRTLAYQENGIVYAFDKGLVGQVDTPTALKYKVEIFLEKEKPRPFFSPWQPPGPTIGFKENNPALEKKHPNDPLPGVSGGVLHPEERDYLLRLAPAKPTL